MAKGESTDFTDGRPADTERLKGHVITSNAKDPVS